MRHTSGVGRWRHWPPIRPTVWWSKSEWWAGPRPPLLQDVRWRARLGSSASELERRVETHMGRASGFSLIELLLATGLALVVTSALFGILTPAQSSFMA